MPNDTQFINLGIGIIRCDFKLAHAACEHPFNCRKSMYVRIQNRQYHLSEMN